MYDYLVIGYSPVACAMRKDKTHQVEELHFKIWLSLKSTILEKKIKFELESWSGLELGLTSIFWMKDISIRARLFKTFRTPVATSSKLDGSTYEL